MGIFKKLLGGKSITVDPADLVLPETVATNQPGRVLKKGSGDLRVDIEIVGESFRADNIAAVSAAAQGSRFDIYLVAEPTNQYDKKAVAVYAANLHVGYIAKPVNRQWFTWVSEALDRDEFLWGSATIVNRKGTSNSGVFGYIYMPRATSGIDAIESREIALPTLKKALARAVKLSETASEPETVTQVKSLSKKAVAVAEPLVAHAKWAIDNAVDTETGKWEDILAVCDSIYSDAERVAYITDAYEIDVTGSIEELAELAGGLELLE